MSVPKKKTAKKTAKSSAATGLQIRAFMSDCPKTVGREQTVAFAAKLMAKGGIRHLPVLHGGRIVGVVSNRDLLLVEAMGGAPADMTVGEAMSQEAFVVKPDATMERVASEMGRRKYGCVVVMEGTKVVGILTTTDLALAFAETLRLFKGSAPGRAS